MALQPVDLPTPENVFAVAATDFRAGLSEDQRKGFQLFDDPCEMITDLQEHIKRHSKGKRSQLLAACSRIESFRIAIEPYFRVVDIVVSSHPEWAAIFWGAVRLVFTLSQNYVSFFEKLADMLGEITKGLPLYGKHMVILQRHALAIASSADEAAKWQKTLDCLSKSLAYVYADILNFCHDARNLFPRRQQGICYKARIIQDLFWTPFDTRFSKTLGRLREHRDLFDRELRFAYSEEILSQHVKIDQKILKNSHHRQEMKYEREERQRKALNDKLRDLKHWIAAPDWAKAHDEAERRRLDGSGKWFTKQSVYQSWAQISSEKGDPKSSLAPLLVISGKPGYGKTVLCSQIVEDLQALVATKSSSSGTSAALVAYFYFTSLEIDFCLSGTAFRAVLAQILQARRFDPEFIDIGSLLHNNGEGQNKASDKEVGEIFHLCLKRLGPSFLVFDGIDECSDMEDFFLSINDILLETPCRVLVLTRPIMDTFEFIDYRKVLHVVLENEKNSGDIETYLRMRMAKLIEQAAIPGNIGLDNIVAQLSCRANSMFLWAVLMSNYLSSPSLSPNERLDAIRQLNRFEGLDAMYNRILKEIHKQTSQKQQSKVIRIFQWVAVAQRPLTVNALRAGLAVQYSHPATSFDFIQNFEKVLSQMCGSLVEIRRDGTVGVIHVSVLEYLTHREEGRHGVLAPFKISIFSSEVSMTGLCLSYLTNEVPHGPLATSSAITPQRDEVETRLPLLSYVSEWWPWHAGRIFMLLERSDCCTQLNTAITAINIAIHNKALVTTWIEALFLFRQERKLTVLVSNLTLLCGISSPSSAGEVVQFVDALNSFCTDVSNLCQRWHMVLTCQPNEIWGPSIQAWSQCEFLVNENHATITSLDSQSDMDWVLISSQVSSDGGGVGMLKVLPSMLPQSMNQLVATSGHAQSPIYGWKASYEIWSLGTLKITSKNAFLIPRERPQEQPERFRLPVALSPSLLTIVVEDTVFRVTDQQSEAPLFTTYSQVLPASGCGHMKKTMIVQRNRKEESLHVRHSVPQHTCYEWFYYIFSPNNQYLALLEGNNFGISASWILTLFEEPYPNLSKPFYCLAASIGLNFSPYVLLHCHEGAEDVRKQDLVCFHPLEPVVAFSPENTAVVWQFTVEGSVPIKVHSQSLLNLCFSSCGEYLYGKSGNGRPLVVLNVASIIRKSERHMKTESAMERLCSGTDEDEGHTSLAVGQRPTNSNQNTMMTSRQPMISMGRDQAQVFRLEQSHDTGSVTLTYQDDDQSLLQTSLARVPASTTLRNSFPTLVKSKDQAHVRLVLNQAPQMSYSSSSIPDIRLPLVFDRQKDTISIERKELPYRIERGGKRRMEYDRDNDDDDDDIAAPKTKFIRNI